MACLGAVEQKEKHQDQFLHTALPFADLKNLAEMKGNHENVCFIKLGRVYFIHQMHYSRLLFGL